jgi:hypothetical protein
VSAARPSRQHSEPERTPAALGDLRARRREARRKRRLARVDLGLGVAGALVLLLVSPGLAITGLIALLVLAGCLISALVGRRARRRAGNSTSPRPRRAEQTGRDPRRP